MPHRAVVQLVLTQSLQWTNESLNHAQQTTVYTASESNYCAYYIIKLTINKYRLSKFYYFNSDITGRLYKITML